MKQKIVLAALLACAASLWAAQDTDITPREVKDPKTLETWLEANASDAQSRLAAVESSGATGSNTLVTVGALSTTGAVTIAEGKLADSTVVSADIKNGTIVGADLDNTAAFTFGSVSTTGAVGIAEGALTDSTVVSADIKNGEIVNADINASAAIDVTKLGTGGLIPANSGASLTNMSLTCFAGKTISFVTITNMVYDGGATTGNVNIVSWQ